jgi:hypothetical protein
MQEESAASLDALLRASSKVLPFPLRICRAQEIFEGFASLFPMEGVAVGKTRAGTEFSFECQWLSVAQSPTRISTGPKVGFSVLAFPNQDKYFF